MRRLLPLFALLLLAFPVQAQTTKSTHSTRPHTTWEQRFQRANTTHDGRLTLGQAQAGDRSVARHFTAIDVTNKGYVTQDDVRAWYKAHHQSASARHQRPG